MTITSPVLFVITTNGIQYYKIVMSWGTVGFPRTLCTRECVGFFYFVRKHAYEVVMRLLPEITRSPIDRFSLNVLWTLCHLIPSQVPIFQFPTIDCTKMAAMRITELEPTPCTEQFRVTLHLREVCNFCQSTFLYIYNAAERCW